MGLCKTTFYAIVYFPVPVKNIVINICVCLLAFCDQVSIIFLLCLLISNLCTTLKMILYVSVSVCVNVCM